MVGYTEALWQTQELEPRTQNYNSSIHQNEERSWYKLRALISCIRLFTPLFCPISKTSLTSTLLFYTSKFVASNIIRGPGNTCTTCETLLRGRSDVPTYSSRRFNLLQKTPFSLLVSLAFICWVLQKSCSMRVLLPMSSTEWLSLLGVKTWAGHTSRHLVVIDDWL